MIEFYEHPSSGYRGRTLINAAADATIAIAVNFYSAGEKLTKNSVKEQGKVYLAIDGKSLEVTDARVERIVKAFNEHGVKTLNIAGNSLHTIQGSYSQAAADAFTYKLLKAVVEHPELENKIVSIRSGGQTGYDESGIKAALMLGIPAIVLAPQGWRFRLANGKDVSDEEQFKARFDNEINWAEKLGKKDDQN